MNEQDVRQSASVFLALKDFQNLSFRSCLLSYSVRKRSTCAIVRKKTWNPLSLAVLKKFKVAKEAGKRSLAFHRISLY